MSDWADGVLARLRERMAAPEPPPLTDWGTTVALLIAENAYRQRVVDEVALQTEGLYRFSRSIQLEPLRAELEAAGIAFSKGEQAVRLPLSTMPKAALLEFDVVGPTEKWACFVSRSDTAQIQLDLIKTLAGAAGTPVPEVLEGLVLGIGLFTPGMLDAAKEDRGDDLDRQLAFAITVAHPETADPDGPEAGPTGQEADDRSASATVKGQEGAVAAAPLPLAEQIPIWRGITAEAGGRLASALAAEPDETSSAEIPLLGLLDTSYGQLAADEITARLQAYAAWIDELHAKKTDEARQTLKMLALFGRRYIGLVDTVIDPDRPALLKTTERRSLPLSSAMAWSDVGLPDWGWIPRPLREIFVPLPSRRWYCQVRLEMRDSRSYHLRVRSEDDSVSVLPLPPAIVSENGTPLTAGETAGLTQGTDGYAMYTASTSRPGHAVMTVPLRLSGDIRRSLTLVFVLTLAAFLVAALPFTIDRSAIALLTLPATFSATVLLVRERSTLSAMILRDYKWGLVIGILLLWILALLRVTGTIYGPDAAATTTTTTTTAGAGTTTTSVTTSGSATATVTVAVPP